MKKQLNVEISLSVDVPGDSVLLELPFALQQYLIALPFPPSNKNASHILPITLKVIPSYHLLYFMIVWVMLVGLIGVIRYINSEMARQQQFDFLFKIVMIGDSGVGKSNLLSRFVDNVFNMDSKPTIGVQFATKTTNIDGKCIKNQIWDTAGQERFRAITNAYYRGAVGAIIAFDLTKAKTFENVQKWLGELKENAEQRITVMLVGNKSDLADTREVSADLIEDYANKNKLYYLETSAATGSNVNEAFTQLIKEIYLKEKAITPPEDPKQQVPLSDKVQKTSTTYTQPPESHQAPTNKPNENMKLKSKEAGKQKKKGCC